MEGGTKNEDGESSTENEDAFHQAMKQIEKEHRLADQETVPAGTQQLAVASPGEQAAVERAAKREEDGEATINYAEAERDAMRVDSGDPVIRQLTQDFDAVAEFKDTPLEETVESPRYRMVARQEAQTGEQNGDDYANRPYIPPAVRWERAMEELRGGAPFILEIFAGTGRLSREVRACGVLAWGIDHQAGTLQRECECMLDLDLTTPQGKANLRTLLLMPNLVYVHLAPPCGTFSRARDNRLEGRPGGGPPGPAQCRPPRGTARTGKGSPQGSQTGPSGQPLVRSCGRHYPPCTPCRHPLDDREPEAVVALVDAGHGQSGPACRHRDDYPAGVRLRGAQTKVDKSALLAQRSPVGAAKDVSG